MVSQENRGLFPGRYKGQFCSQLSPHRLLGGTGDLISWGIKLPERETDHYLVPRVQREHTIMPTLSALPRRAAGVCRWRSIFNNQGASLKPDFISWSRVSSHFIEHKGSFPCSQNPVICHYPVPDKAILRHPLLLL